MEKLSGNANRRRRRVRLHETMADNAVELEKLCGIEPNGDNSVEIHACGTLHFRRRGQITKTLQILPWGEWILRSLRNEKAEAH